ncbi:hypothetical protein CSOJ01_04395 [Colletotrichum sojae]|uniref:Uncharacterized protein n=1 Tax=Colletotrichum sojae TaxID=2175907 RepID=A0A8H6MZE3_9PEZI|nr:hypothetical protein CSOJ01_04395 [Colletotrichum sojae]
MDSSALQADVVGITSAAITSLEAARGLLQATSADDVNPGAVLQAQALGSCFHANGPIVSRLPELLCRTKSVRLERLACWVGWAKRDTPDFPSKTAGGRSAALICFALGALFTPDKCGHILHEVSTKILPESEQTSGITQLGRVCACVHDKLGCLGFGNYLAEHVTRLRQCYFEAGLDCPRDLADTPAEDDVQAFLVCLRDALQDETVMLRYSGTRCAAVWMTLVLLLCPEDVRIEVNREVIHAGIRDTVMLTVDPALSPASFRTESRLSKGSPDLQDNHIMAGARDRAFNANLSFKWEGMLASQLRIALADFDISVRSCAQIQQCIANAAASFAFNSEDARLIEKGPAKRENSFPVGALKTLLGPTHVQVVRHNLEQVLREPSNKIGSVDEEFEALSDMVHSCVSPSVCQSKICRDPHAPLFHGWPALPYDQQTFNECSVRRLWAVVERVVEVALCCLFVHADPEATLRSQMDHLGHWWWAPVIRLWRMGPVDSDPHLGYRLTSYVNPFYLHNGILDMVDMWNGRHRLDNRQPDVVRALSRVCSSSYGSTVFPTTLQASSISCPWSIQYRPVSGRLHHKSEQYNHIVSLPSHALDPTKAGSPPAPPPTISPSGSGEHGSLSMTLRHVFGSEPKSLSLRTIIRRGTQSVEVDFGEIQVGFMSLERAEACSHSIHESFENTEGDVWPTSVNELPRDYNRFPNKSSKIWLALTHGNAEAQFLSCSPRRRQLFQGDCCIGCAITQARSGEYDTVIGGSTSS